jgi:hypothetical protein
MSSNRIKNKLWSSKIPAKHNQTRENQMCGVPSINSIAQNSRFNHPGSMYNYRVQTTEYMQLFSSDFFFHSEAGKDKKIRRANPSPT